MQEYLRTLKGRDLLYSVQGEPGV